LVGRKMPATAGDCRPDVEAHLHRGVECGDELRGVDRRVPHGDPNERVSAGGLDEGVAIAVPTVRGANRLLAVFRVLKEIEPRAELAEIVRIDGAGDR